MAKAHLRAGMVLDGFRIEERLNNGGMATIWRVTRDDIDFPIVMKTPHLAEGEDLGAIVGFEVEQMILPRVTGKHVPRFVENGDFAAQPYIVMERIFGHSLKSRFDVSPLPLDEVVQIGIQTAKALANLHAQHVVHLDLKPSNVMIRENGEAVLIDFGLSRHDQLPDLLAEETRLPIGTAPYISPEQIMGVRTEPRSDLFALGVMLYYFATGERPFGNPKNERGMRRRFWRDPVPPRALRPEIDPWLQEIILRCLEVDPSKRQRNAKQLAFDLAHPKDVVLTERADRLAQDSYLTALKRRFKPAPFVMPEVQSLADNVDRAPIFIAAVDMSAGNEQVIELMRITVSRLVAAEPASRLVCLSVLKTNLIGMDYTVNDQGENMVVNRLVELRDWARPFNLPQERISHHVVEASDPGAVILAFARNNGADHIVLGARGNSTLRRFLGSVSSQVVAEAPCSVTVVRVSTGDKHDETDQDASPNDGTEAAP